jgi:hypothetical protein
MTGRDGSILIAASTMPYNQSCTFSVRSTKASGGDWLLCELPRTGGAGKSVVASTQGETKPTHNFSTQE